VEAKNEQGRGKGGEGSQRDETLREVGAERAAHLAKLRDALCGPRAPGEEHNASAETGLLTKIGATVTVHDFDDSVCELLPALALVRTGGVSAYGQGGVEHQHAGLGPRREVPADTWEDGKGRGGEKTALGHVPHVPSARKKKERKRETKEGDRWRRQGTYAPVLWGDEVWIFGLDFRINLRRAHHEMSDSCHRKEGWRMRRGGGRGRM